MTHVMILSPQKMARSAYAEFGPLPAGKPEPLDMDTKILISQKKSVYTGVDLSTSGVQPPIPGGTIVRYQEIDTTHVSQ